MQHGCQGTTTLAPGITPASSPTSTTSATHSCPIANGARNGVAPAMIARSRSHVVEATGRTITWSSDSIRGSLTSRNSSRRGPTNSSRRIRAILSQQPAGARLRATLPGEQCSEGRASPPRGRLSGAVDRSSTSPSCASDQGGAAKPGGRCVEPMATCRHGVEKRSASDQPARESSPTAAELVGRERRSHLRSPTRAN